MFNNQCGKTESLEQQNGRQILPQIFLQISLYLQVFLKEEK